MLVAPLSGGAKGLQKRGRWVTPLYFHVQKVLMCHKLRLKYEIFFMKILTCLVFGLLIVGCGTTWQVRHHELGEEVYTPRTATYPITVYSTPPSRPYIEVAKIIIKTTWVGTAGFGGSADEAEGIKEMKMRARELGGDGLIYLDLRTAPPGTVGQGHVGGQAIVIRWIEQE